MGDEGAAALITLVAYREAADPAGYALPEAWRSVVRIEAVALGPLGLMLLARRVQGSDQELMKLSGEGGVFVLQALYLCWGFRLVRGEGGLLEEAELCRTIRAVEGVKGLCLVGGKSWCSNTERR